MQGTFFPERPTVAMVMAIVLIAVYYVVLTYIYGVRDDYAFLINATTDKKPIFPFNIVATGRPIYALFVEGFYNLAATVSGLWKIRLVGCIGLWGICFSSYYMLRQFKWDLIPAVTLSLAFVLTPAAAIYAGWAAVAQVPIASLAAIWAGYIALKGGILGDSRKQIQYSIFIAALLLLVSLCLYQTTSPLFIAPMLFYLFSPGNMKNSFLNNRNICLIAFKLAFVFCSVLVIYFLGYKLVVHQFFIDNPDYAHAISRGGLITNLKLKSYWFFLEVLPLTFSWPFIVTDKILVIGFFLLSAYGVIIYTIRTKRWILFPVAGLSIPFLFFPGLIVEFSGLSFRVMGPIYIGSLFFFWLAISQSKFKRICAVISIVIVLNAAILVHFQLKHHLVVLQAKEYSYIKSAIESQFSKEEPAIDAITFLRSPWQNLLPRINGHSEYGVLTSSIPQAYIVETIFADGYKEIPKVEICEDFFQPNACFTQEQLKQNKVDTRFLPMLIYSSH